jgi:hypothetical protein
MFFSHGKATSSARAPIAMLIRTPKWGSKPSFMYMVASEADVADEQQAEGRDAVLLFRKGLQSCPMLLRELQGAIKHGILLATLELPK